MRMFFVHHPHLFEVWNVVHVGLVSLRGALFVGEGAAVGTLLVVHDCATLR